MCEEDEAGGRAHVAGSAEARVVCTRDEALQALRSRRRMRLRWQPQLAFRVALKVSLRTETLSQALLEWWEEGISATYEYVARLQLNRMRCFADARESLNPTFATPAKQGER